MFYFNLYLYFIKYGSYNCFFSNHYFLNFKFIFLLSLFYYQNFNHRIFTTLLLPLYHHWLNFFYFLILVFVLGLTYGFFLHLLPDLIIYYINKTWKQRIIGFRVNSSLLIALSSIKLCLIYFIIFVHWFSFLFDKKFLCVRSNLSPTSRCYMFFDFFPIFTIQI